uniref:Endonuclease-like protein n=3 Tax=Ceratocystis TaxID=5157 RepID=A0A5C1V9M3_9PEZI|nr:endonuclease-like protein [Ceratocystis cacaofunesta]YP_009704191.1 endonuclease-like protein [Ceratocystis fimbriata]YP_009710343.1 endonuclease-like protein [Ceratocystis albifundus]AFO38107.1 endonuclease-like protein [Ceratocystis cacaofunesta]QEN73754.1 endonuclease-like protein [Ceratocystis fimbriata]QFX74845.1 endonuclease-like protein [Ceratocystis albifundus]
MGVRNYSTVNKRIASVDPWFISGLYDAESSFVVVILRNPSYKTGWSVQTRVQIKMHEKDRALLLKIKEYFGGIGNITKPNKNLTVEYRVYSLNDIINFILPHFDKYPLVTKKYTDYLLFKQIVFTMLNKEHVTIEGIQKIVNIRASLNTGLSESLKEAFPNTEPVSISELNSILQKKLNLDWMAGFCTGESNFFITVQKSKTKSGLAVSLRFSVAQHSRDLLLLESFVDFFGCGYTVNYKNRLICEYIVTKIDDITEVIIPFFEEHNILGSKYINYLDFKDASTIIKNKDHLNQEGLEKILQLKNKMTSFYKNTSINNHN